MLSDEISNYAVTDVHCHGWQADRLAELDADLFVDRLNITGLCMSFGEMAPDDVPQLIRMTEASPLALTAIARLAAVLDCEPTREAVNAARAARMAGSWGDYLAQLWSDANIRQLLVDDGFPQPAISTGRVRDESQLVVHRVARIEPWILDLREGATSFDELEEGFAAAAEAAVADGAVAFKSVIAYRTGLDVQPIAAAEARSAFTRWRDDGWVESRAHAKPVRDRLLRRALEVAREADIPLHIHCGAGDPDIVLAYAQPRNLFPLLAEHRRQAIVLIHSGWPWVEEGAYIASVLPHVYLDTSITTPWASIAMDQKLEAVLGIAPTNKVMYGSDEACDPEVLWLSAVLVRGALRRVMEKAVANEWLTSTQAASIVHSVLSGNAERLHGLPAAGSGGDLVQSDDRHATSR